MGHSDIRVTMDFYVFLQTEDARAARRRSLPCQLGELLLSPGVEAAISPSEIAQALRQHARGDWGDLDDEDRRANDQSLGNGTRLLSAYRSKAGVKFWIITEADRSATTVLLPDEY
jgi:hypothetical protein